MRSAIGSVPLVLTVAVAATLVAAAGVVRLPGAAAGAQEPPHIMVIPSRAPAARILVPPSPQNPTVVISAQGVAGRPADEATINATIVANDDVAANATARSNELYTAVQSKLAAAGIDANAISTTSFYVNFLPRPGATYPPGSTLPATPTPFTPPGFPAPRYGYVATRSLSIAVRPIERIGGAIDAALSAGATTVGGVQYGLSNREAVYGEALASAMRAAESQARAVAAAAGMRLGRLIQVQAGGPLSVPAVPLRVPFGNLANVTPILPAPRVEVRATVTVTYALVP